MVQEIVLATVLWTSPVTLVNGGAPQAVLMTPSLSPMPNLSRSPRRLLDDVGSDAVFTNLYRTLT